MLFCNPDLIFSFFFLSQASHFLVYLGYLTFVCPSHHPARLCNAMKSYKCFISIDTHLSCVSVLKRNIDGTILSFSNLHMYLRQVS